MKKYILLLVVSLFLISCTNGADDEVQNCGTNSNVSFDSFSYCGILKQNPKELSFVILNTNDDVQKTFTTCQTLDAVLPDFSKKRILGLLAGPKPTGGFAIKIQSVVENDCEIVVEYFEKEPTKDEVVPTVITYPADYIILPKSNKPILFKKVFENKDYVTIGTYFGMCVGMDCQQFFRIDSQRVLHYVKVNYNSYDFNTYSFESLIYKDEFTAFLQKVPAEIKDLKGKTKTFGQPDSYDQGGVYFEWNDGVTVTKIFFDNDATTDQNQNILIFKKFIKDKILELKTKQ